MPAPDVSYADVVLQTTLRDVSYRHVVETSRNAGKIAIAL